MKKIICGISVTLIIIGVIFFTCFNKADERKIIIDKSNYSNNLSYLLEEHVGKNDFKVQTSSTWPDNSSDYYSFNSRLSGCENGGILSYKDGKVYMEGETSDKCYVYFNKRYDAFCGGAYGDSFACDIAVISYLNPTTGNVYYHDSSLSDSAEDLSYRYSGPSGSVNNYVCFGSDAATCPEDNLYQIIGVFNQDGEYKVKLIKSTYASSTMLGEDGDFDVAWGSPCYFWNSKNAILTNDQTGYKNVWSYSELNTVNLNTNYVNYLKSMNTKWYNMISDSTWIVGGNTYQSLTTVPPKKVYENELLTPDDSIEKEYIAKVGLMYLSDFMFAASPQFWNLPDISVPSDLRRDGNYVDYRATRGNNWLKYDDSTTRDWTITRTSDYQDQIAWCSGVSGNCGTLHNSWPTHAVRPTFYLNSNVQKASGTGTKEDPYRLTV